MPPVISGLSYQVTDSTIVATWSTDIAADSNLSAGGKAAIDNGVAANSTSHQCIVTGLSPSTLYSCTVTSGATTSSPQNVTTSAAPTRIAITSCSFGSPTATTADGDIPYNFLSSDNNTYMIRDDAKTPPGGAGFNQQIDLITNESTLAISLVNGFSNYGAYSTTNGTDGPGSVALSNKINGLFGMNGRLFVFCGRHQITGSTRQQFYGNVIADNGDHGATWNNFTAPGSFAANGTPAYPNSGSNSVAPFYFGNNSNWGWVTPVRYAADDGTLGYNTAGNQIDGANAYVYFTIIEQVNDAADYIYLGRTPRIQLNSLNNTAQEFWIGPASPTATQFVTDANWQTGTTSLTKILTNTGKIGWQDMIFIPTVNYYLLFSEYRPNTAVTSNTVWLVYAGRTPAGPWTQIGTQTNNPSGYYNMSVLHRTATTNNSITSIPLTVVYSSDFQNQPTFYHPTYSTLTLSTGVPPVANTFVQGTGTTTAQSGTTGTLAYVSNVTSGNLLSIAWRYNGSGAVHLTSITSTRTTGNWTIVYDQNDGGATPIQGGWAWALATSTGANTVTLNFNTSVIGIDITVEEHNGPNTLRASSTPAVGTGGAVASNSATAVAGDLQLGFVTLGPASSGILTATSGYNLRATATTSGPTPFVGGSDILSSAGGSVTANFNYNIAGTNYSAGVAIFAALFSITGNAGTAGATVAWSGTATGSTTADGSGNYTIPSLANGPYTITPSKTGFNFSPVNSVQTVSGANITGVNFTATVANAGAPLQITITMLDATTVLLPIPSGFTATQYIGGLRKAGGVWAVAPADSSAGSQWWPYRDWQKVVTS